MKLTKRQKEKLSRILEDIGKLIFMSHVLGFLISPQIMDMPKIIMGFTISIILFLISLIIDKGE